MNLNTFLPVLRSESNSLKRFFSGLILVFSLIIWPAGSALSDESRPSMLKLIELYTSHGCSSCPSADKLLGELLAEDKQLLALEFHVDYWDDLIHGSDGNFVDPFSQASHSMRQRQYNSSSLSGRPGVYTPQVIVNGRFAAVGSNRRHITKALASPVEQLLRIQISAGTTLDTLSLTVTGSAQANAELAGTDISVAYYLDKASTLVTGGENNKKTLVNHRIVTSLTQLGEVAVNSDMSLTMRKPKADEGCVVLVQEDALTPVYAAHGCP